MVGTRNIDRTRTRSGRPQVLAIVLLAWPALVAWERVDLGIPGAVQAVAVDPGDPETTAIVAGSRVLLSRQEGPWRTVLVLPGLSGAEAARWSPEALDDTGVPDRPSYETDAEEDDEFFDEWDEEDDEEKFSAVSFEDPSACEDDALDSPRLAFGAGTLWVASSSGLYRVLRSTPTLVHAQPVRGLSVHGEAVVASDCTRLWISLDGGETWRSRSLSRSGAVSVHAQASVIAAAGDGGVLMSRDLGRTFAWMAGPSTSGIHELAFTGEGELLALTDEGLFRSQDLGRSWRLEAAFENGRRLVPLADGGWLLTFDGGLIRHNAAGTTDPIWNGETALDAAAGRQVWVVTPSGLFREGEPHGRAYPSSPRDRRELRLLVENAFRQLVLDPDFDHWERRAAWAPWAPKVTLFWVGDGRGAVRDSNPFEGDALLHATATDRAHMEVFLSWDVLEIVRGPLRAELISVRRRHESLRRAMHRQVRLAERERERLIGLLHVRPPRDVRDGARRMLAIQEIDAVREGLLSPWSEAMSAGRMQ